MMADSTEVNPRWQGRWDNNEARWHRDTVNENLEKFIIDFVPEGQLLTGRAVFVPLCGKTIDMKWLYDKGFTVVGVEAVEKPILQFFAEQNLEFDVKDVGALTRYSTKDSKLIIFKGNLFDFSEEISGFKFDHYWDRGSFVAIEKGTRKQYGELFSNVMKTGSTGLLEVYEYDPEVHSVQPFPIFGNDVEGAFASSFTFEEVNRHEDHEGSFPRITVVYKLTRN